MTATFIPVTIVRATRTVLYVPSATYTSNYDSGVLAVGDLTELVFLCSVTNYVDNGNPNTMSFNVYLSMDGITNTVWTYTLSASPATVYAQLGVGLNNASGGGNDTAFADGVGFKTNLGGNTSVTFALSIHGKS